MLTGTVFGQEIENQNEARDLGVQVIRFDVPHDTTENPQWIHDTLYRMVGSGIKPWIVFHHMDHVLPVMMDAVSMGGDDFVLPSMHNEPDLGNDALIDEFPPDGQIPTAVYIARVARFTDQCRWAGHNGLVLAGGISNLNDRGFAYLEQTAPYLPGGCGQEFHLYPGAYQLPWMPHKGEGGSHKAGLDKLKALIGDRPACCGEFGWNMASRKPFPRLTEDQIYGYLKDWFRMFDRAGFISAACCYQWRDGNTDDAMGRFGIHTESGQPKRQAAALKDWRT